MAILNFFTEQKKAAASEETTAGIVRTCTLTGNAASSAAGCIKVPAAQLIWRWSSASCTVPVWWSTRGSRESAAME